jgi:hypothetical protein
MRAQLLKSRTGLKSQSVEILNLQVHIFSKAAVSRAERGAVHNIFIFNTIKQV